MPSRSAGVPDVVPQLSRGKHRSPRKGACFMELASFLAGERWSDRPSCTHPLLAALARLVNDHTTDDGRDALGPLVPSVIGLTSDDPRVDVRIALRAAVTALPVAAAERQRVLAVSILAAQRALVDLDGAVDPATRGSGRRGPDLCARCRHLGPGVHRGGAQQHSGLRSPCRPQHGPLRGRGHRSGLHPRPRRPAAHTARRRDRRQLSGDRPGPDRRRRRDVVGRPRPVGGRLPAHRGDAVAILRCGPAPTVACLR